MSSNNCHLCLGPLTKAREASRFGVACWAMGSQGSGWKPLQNATPLTGDAAPAAPGEGGMGAGNACVGESELPLRQRLTIKS
jgi:hypothetical protein